MFLRLPISLKVSNKKKSYDRRDEISCELVFLSPVYISASERVVFFNRFFFIAHVSLIVDLNLEKYSLFLLSTRYSNPSTDF